MRWKLWSSSPQIEWYSDQLSPSTPQPCCLVHGWEQLPPRRRTQGRSSRHHRIGDSLDLTTATWNIGPKGRADRADPGPPDGGSPEDQELTKKMGAEWSPERQAYIIDGQRPCLPRKRPLTCPPIDAKDGVKTPACREQLNRPVVPHPFKIGDSVWVRRHQSRNLEPRLTGQRLGSTRRM
ncbi:uncharacterized protein LOC143270169 isoform X1 [Peromyscus maniculatus bairdii]|uniref:uncharacterized protein LOC143270169 isoform X1 n=1 Tax=Peromyscus maniculatus bairdii TaxID=230844 RepID=UPI003FD121FE